MYCYYDGTREVAPGYKRSKFDEKPFGVHMDVNALMARQVCAHTRVFEVRGLNASQSRGHHVRHGSHYPAAVQQCVPSVACWHTFVHLSVASFAVAKLQCLPQLQKHWQGKNERVACRCA